MTGPPLYPLRFEPMFQHRLWGGRRLGDWMGQTLGCVDGGGVVEQAGRDWPMDRGAVVRLPAALGACAFRRDETVTLLEIAIPDPP